MINFEKYKDIPALMLHSLDTGKFETNKSAYQIGFGNPNYFYTIFIHPKITNLNIIVMYPGKTKQLFLNICRRVHDEVHSTHKVSILSYGDMLNFFYEFNKTYKENFPYAFSNLKSSDLYSDAFSPFIKYIEYAFENDFEVRTIVPVSNYNSRELEEVELIRAFKDYNFKEKLEYPFVVNMRDNLVSNNNPQRTRRASNPYQYPSRNITLSDTPDQPTPVNEASPDGPTATDISYIDRSIVENYLTELKIPISNEQQENPDELPEDEETF